MKTHPRPQPQRVAWFEGSALTHRDLRDAVELEARLLELHVRAVHDTYGIAFGLTTAPSADKLTVVVQPGLAYTCRGESLVVLGASTVAAPPASMTGTTFDLLLVRATPRSGCTTPDIDCGANPLGVHATLQWISLDASNTRCTCGAPDDAVPLGRYIRAGATLVGPDNAQRRGVHAAVSPHVASGITQPGALVWRQSDYDLYADVDTSAGGFTGSPVYFASLASPIPWAGGLVAPFVAVSQATATRFTLHVMIVARPPAFSLLFAQIDVLKGLAFAWTGVESTVGCSSSNLLLTTPGTFTARAALGGII